MKKLILALTLFSISHSSIADQNLLENRSKLQKYFSENENSLTVKMNDVVKEEWRIGTPVVFTVGTDSRVCDVQLLHLDGNGVASTYQLGTVSPNKELRFPEQGELTISAPTGRDDLFFLCGSDIPNISSLEIENKEGVYEVSNVGILTEKLISSLDASNDLQLTSIGYYTRGKNESVAMTADEIVSFYVERSRTIKRPTLPLQVLFKTNSDELSNRDKRVLDQVAIAMKSDKLESSVFEIAGHTDDRGTDDYNMGLSDRRATSVKKYLIDNHGLKSTRVLAVSYGESNPALPNDSDENRAINRRVEFKMKQDQGF